MGRLVGLLRAYSPKGLEVWNSANFACTAFSEVRIATVRCPKPARGYTRRDGFPLRRTPPPYDRGPAGLLALVPSPSFPWLLLPQAHTHCACAVVHDCQAVVVAPSDALPWYPRRLGAGLFARSDKEHHIATRMPPTSATTERYLKR